MQTRNTVPKTALLLRAGILLSTGYAFAMLLQQSYRPETGTGMVKTLELLEKLSKQVKLYRLGCNMEPEAARISYQGMQEEE